MIKPELEFVYEAGGEPEAPRLAQQVDLRLRRGALRRQHQAVGLAGDLEQAG